VNTTEPSAAGLNRFDVVALRDVAGEKAFARGAAYHEDDRVEIVALDMNRVQARVMGSEVYRCDMAWTGRKFSGQCSCPAFPEWGFCKHLVATALTANGLQPGALKLISSRFARIREHLRAKGIDRLVEMVVRLAEHDPSLLKELELSAVSAAADDTTLLAQFKKAITDATRTHGYVEYSKMHDWVQGLDGLLDQIADLVENGRAGVVLPLLDHFFVRMDEALENVDDSDGGGGEVYARAREIHLAACDKAKPDPVKLARALFAREVESQWEFFHGASVAYEDVLGEIGLAEYRSLASKEWQKMPPLRATGQQARDDQYSARYALRAILESFAEREGDVDGMIAIRTKDLSTAHNYLGIAQLCLDHAREAEALKWAEEGLWQFEDNPDERLMCFASDLYRRMGREEDADTLLWRAFERRPSVALYERLKAVAGTDQMSVDAVRDRAMAWLRSQLGKPSGLSGLRWSSAAELIVRLAMAEGLFTDAWEVAGGHGCSEELLQQLAEASEHSHPAEALRAYAHRVERKVALGGQSNYQYAYQVIGRMRLLREALGEAKQHAAYLVELRSRHKAKRNFMKLLK
jgi:uncharacterized Zn finger protein